MKNITLFFTIAIVLIGIYLFLYNKNTILPIIFDSIKRVIKNHRKNKDIKRASNNPLLFRDMNITFKELITDLDIYEAVCFENYKFINVVNNGDIYYSKERFNKEVNDLTVEIISGISQEFFMKCRLFMTDEQTYKLISVKVMQLLSDYGIYINKPK